MEVTEQDLFYYTSAVEKLSQKFEISREFVRNKGMSFLPMEELRELMIVGVKEWLEGDQGEKWLGTLGYYKGEVTISGSITISGAMCPVCSGSFAPTHGTHCECCGRFICDPCISVVDPIYHIGWCPDCVETYPLTNLLVYSE